MCIDEFVKRLYDFMGIYRIFWSQNSHYRYFIDIFSEIPAQTCVLHSRNFSAKNRRFYRFFPDFFSAFFFSVSTENRFFGDIATKKNDFLFHVCYK